MSDDEDENENIHAMYMVADDHDVADAASFRYFYNSSTARSILHVWDEI